MRYSFIIPTLNEESLLEVILKQIKKLSDSIDLEIIVSDGGSSDNTIQIAKKYTNKIVENSSNKKQTIAEGRNEGAKIANGDILVFICADVMIKDIKTFIDEIEMFSNSDMLAMTSNVRVFEDKEILSDKLFLTFYNVYFHLLNVIGVGMGRGECQIVKKDVYNSVGGYNINLSAGEDLDLYKRIRRVGQIYFSRKVTILESPRRYRKEGHLKILVKWSLNGLAVLFKNKSYSNEWEQVR